MLVVLEAKASMKEIYRLMIICVFCLLFQRLNCSIAVSPRHRLVSDEYTSIYCLKPDEYRRGVLLVCAKNSVMEYNLVTSNYSMIAGSYSQNGYIEGRKEGARFKTVNDLVQLNRESMIVTDSENFCLRWVNSSSTSVLAGSCISHGFQDGNFAQARFRLPISLLLMDSNTHLYVLDSWNNALILMSFVTRMVQTVQSGDFRNIHINFPTSMTCINPECVDIYISFSHGVTRYSRHNDHMELIAGGQFTGDTTGSVTDTKFDSPSGILFLTRDILIVADTTNKRLVTLDTTNNQSHSIPTFSPSSLLCYNNSLYSGEFFEGLFKWEVIDAPEDLICYNPDTGYPNQSTTNPQTTSTTTTNPPTPSTPTTEPPKTTIELITTNSPTTQIATTTSPTTITPISTTILTSLTTIASTKTTALTTIPPTPSTIPNMPTTNNPIEALTTPNLPTVGPSTTALTETIPPITPTLARLTSDIIITVAAIVGFLIAVVAISLTIVKIKRNRLAPVKNGECDDRPAIGECDDRPTIVECDDRPAIDYQLYADPDSAPLSGSPVDNGDAEYEALQPKHQGSIKLPEVNHHDNQGYVNVNVAQDSVHYENQKKSQPDARNKY